MTSSVPPLGVPAASATEPDAMLLDHHYAVFTSNLFDSASFNAVADGGGAAGSLLATLIGAAIGAFLLEYIATNEAAPIPDPLLGGIWGTLHSATRTPSKLVGGIANTAMKAAVSASPFGK
eukprot:CAMPEP_0115871302 /NCGR_PEP_ID=MMETSP0287-20121206/22793_1 /TAXON_ID=412157 /ORGANISM="Chrysochromulina rotalis, Strain UIO044" /LENGTH=120 /DNA_ID=CAMNT_0003326093 /DNA_START=18 /DNA_END=380 /DNA_ORIENTATION=+